MMARAIAVTRLMSTAAIVTLASSIGLLGAMDARLQDRPAPPTDVSVSHCNRQAETPPAICVNFKNTATEPVGFWFEWTRNGEKLPSTLKGYDAYCEMRGYDCEAFSWFGGPSRYQPQYTTERLWPFGFTLRNLDYDTEFCFRFKTVNKDGVVSENWTNWACADTGPVPVIRSAPRAPVVTLFQATSGRRAVGDGTPPRLLVEWEKVPENVGWYEIEGDHSWTPTRHAVEAGTEVMLTLPTNPESPITKDSKFKVRICAANPAMRKCSPWGENIVVTSTLAEARDRTTQDKAQGRETSRFEPGASANVTAIERRPAAATANLVGSEVSLQASNFLDRFIRHRNLLGYIEPIAGDLARRDATFRIVAGLNGRCVSLESQNHPDHFLRHEGFRIKLARRENTPLFRDDATFCLVSGLTSSTGVSLESVSIPGRFIRHRNSELWLDRSDGSDQFRKDATFNVTHPGGQMIVK
jgi:hypothetical protein